MRSRAIFVCLTPYHLSIAIEYAEKLKKEEIESILIWKPDFRSEIAIKEYTKPFTQVIEIKRRYKNDNEVMKVFKRCKDRIWFPFSKVSQIVKEQWEQEKLFVFNDLEYWTYRMIKEFGEKKEIILLEEGTALYVDREVRSNRKQKINEFLFGQKRTDYIQYSCGGCKDITTIICQNPMQLPDIKKKGRNVILREEMQSSIFCEKLQASKEFQKLSENLRNSENVLYLGQNNKEIGINDNAIITLLETIIGNLKENEKLIIKPHSREIIKKYDIIRKKRNVILLDNAEFSWYPVETFISLLHVNKVITVASSSAINLAENEKMEVWVLYKLFGLDYDAIFSGRGNGNLTIVDK